MCYELCRIAIIQHHEDLRMLSCQLSWVSQKGSPNANPVQMLIIISIDETLHCLLYIAHLSLYIYIPIQLI
jgi:hypothetical protein